MQPPAFDWSRLDPLTLGMLDDRRLAKRVVAQQDDLIAVRSIVESAINRRVAQDVDVEVNPLEVHRQIAAGLPGDALIVAGSLLLDNQKQAAGHFLVSFKTFKARIGQTLDPQASELAMRTARAVIAASQVLGSFEAARAYLRTRNFALGGAAPIDLLKTAEGERLVLNELHAQAEGAPL